MIMKSKVKVNSEGSCKSDFNTLHNDSGPLMHENHIQVCGSRQDWTKKYKLRVWNRYAAEWVVMVRNSVVAENRLTETHTVKPIEFL